MKKTMEINLRNHAISDQNKQNNAGNKSASVTGSAAPRYFTVGELWGPCPCLVDGCPSYLAWTIKLTAEENNKLPEQSGPEAVKYIFKHKLGIPMCESCLGKEKR